MAAGTLELEGESESGSIKRADREESNIYISSNRWSTINGDSYDLQALEVWQGWHMGTMSWYSWGMMTKRGNDVTNTISHSICLHVIHLRDLSLESVVLPS